MKRLTRKETIVVREKETAACNYENDDCNDQCRYGTCRWQEKANMILKEYEDTGLTPQEIMELKELLSRESTPEITRSSRDNNGWILVDERLPEVDADIEETIEDDDCTEYIVLYLKA